MVQQTERRHTGGYTDAEQLLFMHMGSHIARKWRSVTQQHFQHVACRTNAVDWCSSQSYTRVGVTCTLHLQTTARRV